MRPGATGRAGDDAARTRAPLRPQGDSGTVTISVGGKTLPAPALENFREQDFHRASAILVAAGQKVTITVAYRRAEGHDHGRLPPAGTPPGSGPAPTQCSAADLISGTLEWRSAIARGHAGGAAPTAVSSPRHVHATSNACHDADARFITSR